MPNLGVWELVALLVVLVLLFGAKRLPEIARTAGRGVREFRDTVDPVRELKESVTTTPAEIERSFTGEPDPDPEPASEGKQEPEPAADGSPDVRVS
jgi:sec-independent protein translocase protein TatA